MIVRDHPNSSPIGLTKKPNEYCAEPITNVFAKKMAATISNIGWYTSVIIIISRGKNRYQSRFSELIPKNSLNGEEIIAEVDPVIAKTMKILAI